MENKDSNYHLNEVIDNGEPIIVETIKESKEILFNLNRDDLCTKVSIDKKIYLYKELNSDELANRYAEGGMHLDKVISSIFHNYKAPSEELDEDEVSDYNDNFVDTILPMNTQSVLDEYGKNNKIDENLLEETLKEEFYLDIYYLYNKYFSLEFIKNKWDKIY
jgi:hypothetical protein